MFIGCIGLFQRRKEVLEVLLKIFLVTLKSFGCFMYWQCVIQSDSHNFKLLLGYNKPTRAK